VDSVQGKHSALPMRRKSTCLRMTSSGSARDTGPFREAACDGRRAGSRDKALAPMREVNFCHSTTSRQSRLFRPGRINLAGSSRVSARHRYRAAGAGSRTTSRPGTSHGAAGGTASRSCFHCRAPGINCLGGGAGGCGGYGACTTPGRVWAGQAAFARRILRRRSADRSSSFSPPQVPYFSGRLTA
jgi:hypothetical protein